MKAVLTPSRAAWQNLVRKKSAAADLQALQRKIVELQNEAEKLVRRQPPTFAGGLRLNQVQAQLETCRQALTLATQKVAAEDHKQAQAAIQVEPQAAGPGTTARVLKELAGKQRKEAEAAHRRMVNNTAADDTRYVASKKSLAEKESPGAYDSDGNTTE